MTRRDAPLLSSGRRIANSPSSTVYRIGQLRIRTLRPRDAAASLVADVFGRFSEGLDTPDLIEAKELPEELGRARPFRLKI